VVLEKLLAAGAVPTPQRGPAVTMLAATIMRSTQHVAIQTLLSWAADERLPIWQRTAVLRGAEVAVLGAEMPGTPIVRRAVPQPPCPTCPGARGGPGGAYAFPEARGSAVAGRGGTRGIRLSGAPVGLLALADAGGELGSRATALLARLAWSGKPGTIAAAPPLTTEEQARFDAGQLVYHSLCVGCHQPDGRGQEKIAPPLVDSPLALGSAGIPVRILLNGKEGSIGLMPPVGSVLDDNQIAAVLTYIRREWGHTGSPVDAGLVRETRAAAAGRSRPWTTEELNAIEAIR
jgi:mono/diheme cytochrome c family protein